MPWLFSLTNFFFFLCSFSFVPYPFLSFVIMLEGAIQQAVIACMTLSDAHSMTIDLSFLSSAFLAPRAVMTAWH